MISYLKKNYSWLIIIYFGLIYFLFLSNNPTSDSYSNAFSSITGLELFRPHHLLYSGLGYLIYLPLQSLDIDPIKIFQFVNVLFAMGCFIVFRVIMHRIHSNEKLIASSIVFLGACFGFQRFAIDNECYIIPLFFTLLAINFVQSFLIRNRDYKVILSALTLAIGCLFHQIVIFAWLASFLIFIFNGRRRYILQYFLISLIIPIVYIIVVYYQEGSVGINAIMNFVFHDYKNSNAEMPILSNVILLSAISFFRTFIQVHGYVFEIISLFPLISSLVISIALGFLVYGIIYLFRLKKRQLTVFQERRFVRYCWGMFILYFAFAAFSNGNAEFMVILPFLIILLLVYYFEYLSRALFGLGIFMYVFNLFFALIPMANMKLNSNEEIVNLMIDQPNAVFVLKDKVAVENIYAYKQRKENVGVTFRASEVSQEKFDSWLKENKTIYTDYFEEKDLTSRATIAKSKTNDIKTSNPIINNKNSFYPKYKFTSLVCEKEIWTYIN
ncbi:MAG: hypothetical protein PHO12_03720 [Bacteroidales bacterium]|nr:hypothetical protein [Bacteroidales bacterium]